ncbi:MAG: N-acetyltransferase family protein [Hyphomicrobiales bacterium]
MTVAPATIAVRKAGKSDAAAMAAVHAVAWREAYLGILPHTIIDAMIARRGPARWAGVLAKPNGFRVIEFGGEVAGYTSFGPARNRIMAAKSEIYEIYLAPVYQGIGLGCRLFSDTRDAADKTHGAGLIVWVLTENRRAVAFYRALGGKPGPGGIEQLGEQRFEKSSFLWV